LIVRWDDRPTQHRLDTEHAEIIPRDDLAERHPRRSIDVQCGAVWAVGDNGVENIRARANVLDIRIRARPVCRPIELVSEHIDQAARSDSRHRAHRQRLLDEVEREDGEPYPDRK
jgi:hypothetical protein